MSEQVVTAQQGFNDPYGSMVSQADNMSHKTHTNTWERIGDHLFGTNNRDKAAYNQMMLEETINRANVTSARAWDEYFDSTAVQRRMKDIQAAGLNPWLALQSGGIQANGSAGSDNSPSSAKYHSKESKDGNPVKDIVGTAIKIIGMLALLG